MTLNQKDPKTMEERIEKWWRNEVGLRNILTSKAWSSLADLLRSVREDALEEAAKQSECYHVGRGRHTCYDLRHEISGSIRSLKGQGVK